MFEVKERTKKIVRLYGVEHMISMPTVKQSRDYEDAIQASDSPLKRFDLMAGFLEELGLPKEALLNLENIHLSDLIDYLSNKKKD